MEIAPSNIEVCLKLNRFVCGDAENDVVALSDSRVRILSSHELATVTTVSFLEGQPQSLPSSRPPTQRDLQKSNLSSPSELGGEDKEPQVQDQNAVFIDGTVEEVPVRKPSKFMQLLNQERKARWALNQSSLPVDGTSASENEHSSRLHKGMHAPPDRVHGTLNPLRQEQLVAKQIRDDMFMDIMAQQRNQNFADNISQVSGMSAKERILKTGHATGIPDNLRQL